MGERAFLTSNSGHLWVRDIFFVDGFHEGGGNSQSLEGGQHEHLGDPGPDIGGVGIELVHRSEANHRILSVPFSIIKHFVAKKNNNNKKHNMNELMDVHAN